MGFVLGKLDLTGAERARPPMADPQVTGFRTVADRLQSIIEYETDALSRHAVIDLAEVNRQKRQGMLELTRVLRGFGDQGPPPPVRDRLATLTSVLDKNRAVLGVQLSAVREVAEIIAGVMRDADWDGTYSAQVGRP